MLIIASPSPRINQNVLTTKLASDIFSNLASFVLPAQCVLRVLLRAELRTVIEANGETRHEAAGLLMQSDSIRARFRFAATDVRSGWTETVTKMKTKSDETADETLNEIPNAPKRNAKRNPRPTKTKCSNQIRQHQHYL